MNEKTAMRIALIGYGKMGKALEARLLEKGHTLVFAVDPLAETATGEKNTATGAAIYPSLEDCFKNGNSSKNIDIAIEFTRPGEAPANISFLIERKIPVVTGTTGWYDKLQELSEKVKNSGAALLWAANFSLGVNLFYRIAAGAARLMDKFPEYDAGGFEAHHNKKADSPSGTAKILAGLVLSNMKRKTTAVYDKLDRPPAPEEFHFASLRTGSVPGVHSLVFDSSADTIEITHTARSREGLAAGAILAAEWLFSRPENLRRGVFTMDDVLENIGA